MKAALGCVNRKRALLAFRKAVLRVTAWIVKLWPKIYDAVKRRLRCLKQFFLPVYTRESRLNII